MLDLIMTGLLGGGTGLLGAGLKAWSNHAKQKAAEREAEAVRAHEVTMSEEREKVRAHEITMRKIDAELDEAERAAAEKRTAMELEAEADRERTAADKSMYLASVKSDRATYSDGLQTSQWITDLKGLTDVVKGWMRPSVTWYSLIQCALEKDPTMQHFWIYLASTCVSWWFGTRKLGNAPKGEYERMVARGKPAAPPQTLTPPAS